MSIRNDRDPSNSRGKSKGNRLRIEAPTFRLIELLEDRLTPALNFLGLDTDAFASNLASPLAPNTMRFLGAGLNPSQIRYAVPTTINAADTTNADDIWVGGSSGLNLTGNGITVAVWEAGGGRILSTHQELAGRVTNGDAGGGLSGHATSVASIIAATGINPNARGMASQVTIVNYTADGDTGEMASDGASYLLSNHSYGFVNGWLITDASSLVNGVGFADVWLSDRSAGADALGFGKYDSSAAAIDDALFTHQNLLSVWAAGNDRGEQFENIRGDNSYVTFFSVDPGGIGFAGAGWYLVSNSGATAAPGPDGNAGTGFDSLPQSQTAKNTLVVGSIADITKDPYLKSDVNSSSFSGWGPTDDGRLKVDIVGNGEGVFAATTGANNAYGSGSGTSFASPNVTGSIALLDQYYRQLFGGDPSASTMKAVVLHTAFDAGNIGPDFSYGWGVMDSLAAANLLNAMTDADPSDHQYQADYKGTEWTVDLKSDGTGPIRATLVWTDPAGTPQNDNVVDDSTRVLVNDLDLWITGPDGTIYHPWTLDGSDPSAPAVRVTRNSVDNVEQVLIDVPTAGAYTVHVGHSGNVTTQPFSLIVSGAKDAPGPIFAQTSPFIGYVENQGPVILDSGMTVSDPDTPIFNGGKLTISFTSGYTSDDKIAIQSAGSIAVFGSAIFYNGTGIGSFTGNGGTTGLSITFNGNADFAAVSALLQSITFTNDSETPVTGDRKLTWRMGDGDGGNAIPVTSTISVSSVNDTPVVAYTGTSTISVQEDSSRVISGFSISDIDAGSGSVSVTLSVSNGKLTVNSSVSNGISNSGITGNGTSEVSLFGPIANINNTLASLTGVTYQSIANFFGNDTLTFVVDDHGNAGGPPQTSQRVVPIEVVAVNDAPVNTKPLSVVEVDEDTPTPILGLAISDSDAGTAPMTLRLQSNIGRVTLSTTASGGLTAGQITGNGTSNVIATGTLAQINATLASLNGVLYTSALNYNGLDTITMTTNDAGNTGAGGALSDVDPINISVRGINDAPVNAVPLAPFAMNGDQQVFVSGIQIVDVDADSTLITVKLTAANGKLIIDPDVAGGVPLGQIAFNGTPSVILTGTLDQINATLADANGLLYQGNPSSFGDTITISTNDGGNSGEGGAKIDTDVLAISDAPIETNQDIVGDNLNNTIVIRPYGTSTTDVIVQVDGITRGRYSPSANNPIRIYGEEGNDFIQVQTTGAIGFVLNGGGGADTIEGGDGADTILGGSGNDLIFGKGENDLLFGQDGNDSIDGGLGNDGIDGNAGDDQIFGSEGDDFLFGSDGNDRIDGGSGDDGIDGGLGNDYASGGDGADYISGSDGIDSLDGAAGNDSIDGGAGADQLFGSAGDDVIFGLAGQDRIDGGEGNDGIDAGADNDIVFGGGGNDMIFGGDGADQIDGGAGDDSVDGNAGNDLIFLGAGNDLAFGSDGNDSIQGDAGNDTIGGGAGNDLLFGNAGDDIMYGESGNDNLDGGAGVNFNDGGTGTNFVK